MKYLTLITVATAALTLTACDTSPKNEGAAKSYRLETRVPGEGNRLGSADLVVATEQAVEAMVAKVPEMRESLGTVVVMDRVENKTSDPSANFEIYLARILALLNDSGARHHITFVTQRSRAEAIKSREGVDPADSQRIKPRYALTGSFYDLPRGRTNYHLLVFEMVDLRTDELHTIGKYEVKL